MEVHEAIMSRRSVRRFLDKPVSQDAIRKILTGAGMAPSGHNIQPWHVYVVRNEMKARISGAILETIHKGEHVPHDGEYDYYPTEWFEPYVSRRRGVGFKLYDLLGIKREDMEARQAQMERNFIFFDAPVGLFITFDRRLAMGTFLDVGMFIENILIGARGEGLHTCGQVAFTPFHQTIREHLGFDDNQMLVCGIALGFEDETAPENQLRTEKIALEEFVTFVDG